MNEPHLSDIALIVLAARRAPHPHIQKCVWCREQYDALLAMEERENEEDVEPPVSPFDRSLAGSFRLAAQSSVDTDAPLLLRQTWYLDEGKVLLRVFEEAGAFLIGYVICAPERLQTLRLRFSGLLEVFTPQADGSFRIGKADLPIEPMSVTLEEH